MPMHRLTNRAFGLTFFAVMATIVMLRWWFTDRVSLTISVIAGFFFNSCIILVTLSLAPQLAVESLFSCHGRCF